MLLLLDGFEHLLAGAGFLVELLERAPDVKLLVTSRERLYLRLEEVPTGANLPPGAAGTRHRPPDRYTDDRFTCGRTLRTGLEPAPTGERNLSPTKVDLLPRMR